MSCLLELGAGVHAASGLDAQAHAVLLGPRLVAPQFDASKVTVDIVITVAFRLYLVIIVRTLTN